METQAEEFGRSETLAGPKADRELAAALLAGDRKATAEFLLRYSDRLFSYVWQRMLPRTEGVEDLVQDCFLIAWRSLQQYRGDATLESWLIGIARHLVEDHYRKSLRASLSSWEENDEEGVITGFKPLWDEEIDQQRVRERTTRILAELPEPYSVALQWRYWEKRSAREMARLTGKTEKSVERLLTRARDAFRRRWEDE